MRQFIADLAAMLLRSSRKDAEAKRQLVEALYEDLHREAERLFQAERKEHTLQPTALVHESLMRLVGQRQTEWQNRDHFLSVASQMMRRILTDHARMRLRSKRLGGRQKTQATDLLQLSVENSEDVLAVHDLLEKLESLDPRQAKIVELRFFFGMTNPEIALTLGVSLRTVEAEWSMAKAWLRRELSDDT